MNARRGAIAGPDQLADLRAAYVAEFADAFVLTEDAAVRCTPEDVVRMNAFFNRWAGVAAAEGLEGIGAPLGKNPAMDAARVYGAWYALRTKFAR